MTAPHHQHPRGICRWALSLLLSLISSTLGWTAADARPQPAFEHLEGTVISNAHVTAIHQDRLGFMWIGTQGGGLNRYDGYEVVVYAHDARDARSLPSNNVTDVFEGADGALWVGTWAGLSRYDRDRETFQSWVADDGSGLLGWVNVIAETRDGTLWLGTMAGVNRFDPRTGTFDVLSFEPDPAGNPDGLRVHDIVEDAEGRLWLASEGGVYRVEPETGASRRFGHDPDDRRSLPGDRTLDLELDRRGRLWVGTEGAGLARLDPRAPERGFDRFGHEPGRPESLSTDRVRVLFEDARGRLWIGTENGGLDRFDEDAGVFWHARPDQDDPKSLRHGSVWALHADRVGDLWVGTFAGGVDVMRPRAGAVELYQHVRGDPRSLMVNAITEFHEDRAGQLWVGADGGGFHRFDPQTRTLERFNTGNTNLSNDAVLALHRSAAGDLWVGTWAGGLGRFDVEQGRFVDLFTEADGGLPSNNVFDITEDDQGHIWAVCFGGGLVRVDPATRAVRAWRTDNSDLPNDELLALLRLPDGALALAMQNHGFAVFDPETEAWATYRSDPDPQPSTGLSEDNVQAFAAPDARTLWLGTQNGLSRFDREAGTFEHFFRSDGLPGDQVTGLAFDGEGRLWVATNAGLCQFDVEGRACRTLTVEDGLQGDRFTRFASLGTSSGALLFGGRNGFNVIYPERLTVNAIAPPVVLTGFQLFSRPVEIGAAGSPLGRSITTADEIVLTHDQNVISFTFAALDFTRPARNHYAYMLEGFDTDWHRVGARRTATYSNLDPGRYVLRVRGANSDGVWNEAGARLRVVVQPPFWGTWWFRGLLGLLGLGLLAFLVRGARRQGQLEATRAQLEIEAGLREQAQAASKAKGEFIANISHELRTPMNGVMGMLELSLRTSLTDAQRENLTLALSSARSLLVILNDLLDLSKIEAGKLRLERTHFALRQRLSVTIKALAARAQSEGLELALDIDPDVPDPLCGDPLRLAQVLVNLVGNAIKFTERGEVVVSVSRSVPEGGGAASAPSGGDASAVTLRFTVRDTGIGVAPEKLQRVFEAFEQADMSTTRRYGGTGLGLVIASHLVELMGGQIGVDSVVGEGSTFEFTARFEVDTTAEGQPLALPPAHHGLGVLVVDDNATYRDIIARMLTRWALEPTTVVDGAAALAALKGADTPAFSLVIVDHELPDMSGLDLARRLRQRWSADQVGLVMLTSLAELDVQQQIDDLAVAARVAKPFTGAELFDVIHRVLTGASAGVLPMPSTAPRAEDPSPKPALRILLAEDNPVNQTFATKFLHQAGHSVVCVDDGQSAVHAWRGERFDIILMDMQMPIMDGLTAAKTIRAEEASARVPIVALTAHAHPEDRERCLQAGMDAYLSKPVRIAELEATIDALVSPAESG